MRDELRPGVVVAKNTRETQKIIEEMLGRLEQSHFGVVPDSAYDALGGGAGGADGAEKSGEGSIGIELRIIDGKVLVTRVLPASPAAKAGVATGWQITHINSAEVAPVIAEIQESFKDSTTLPHILVASVQRRLDGAVDSKVKITFIDGIKLSTYINLKTKRAHLRQNIIIIIPCNPDPLLRR